MMDTPDKNRISAVSLSSFEDSPVFKYISDLSPIEPVKSIHTDHILSSLILASPSSLSTSPQINSHRESRFSIRRHQSPGLSNATFFQSGTSDNKRDVAEVVSVSDPCDEQLKWVTPRSLDKEAKPEPSGQQFDLAIELPMALKNACDGCHIQMISCDTISTDKRNATDKVGLIEKSDKDKLKQQNCPFDTEADLTAICPVQKDELADGSDIGMLISDITNLLDTKGHDQNIADCGASSTFMQFPCNVNNNSEDVESGGSSSCGKHSVAGAPDTHFGNSQNALAVDNPNAKTEVKEERCLLPSRKQRSVRRRCLVFEMAGSYRKKPVCDSVHCSSQSLTTTEEVPSPATPLVPSRTDIKTPLSMPRAIGLHLNGLVNTLKDGRAVEHQMLASDKKLILKPACVPSHASSTPHQTHDECITPASMKRDLVSCQDEAMIEAPEKPADGEHFDDDTSTGKRHKSEHVEESNSCKRCNCRRSKCLKLYCDCFAAGLYCIEPCSCQGCLNKPIHEDVVMETRKQIEARNPLAFAPKVVKNVDSAPDFQDENNKTPASARHKRGCNCKRSGCLKKYCECFQVGVGCSPSCRCKGCKNTFGRKDDAGETGVNDEDPEELKRDGASESNAYDNVAMKSEEGPEDPPFVNSSFASEALPAPFPGASVCRSPASACPKLRLSNSCHHQQKFESHLQMIPQDEMPERTDAGNQPFPEAVMAACSNYGSILPPHHAVKPSTQHHSRKLILRSVPPFPSLASP